MPRRKEKPPEEMYTGGAVTYRRCKGTASTTGERCRRAAMVGRDYCMKHGGRTGWGIQNTNFKTGMHSQVIPARLRQRYIDSLNNPDKLLLDEELAVLDARLGDLLARVDTGESGQIWIDLQTAWQELMAARRRKDPEAQAEALDRIGRLIGRGYADHRAWADVRETIQDVRRVKESERRRIVEAQETLTLQQAMALITALQESVRRNVPDAQARDAIAADIIRLSNVSVR